MAAVTGTTDYEKAQALKGMRLYSISEVCQVLNVSRQTLQAYAREGRIKAIKIGHAWRITENALREFLNAPKAE